MNDFSNLEPRHKLEIEVITDKFEPYSDFNFVSMYSWDTDNSLRWKIVDGNLVVKFKEYGSDQHFYSIIGQNKLIDSIAELLEIAKKENLETPLRLIPEIVVNNIHDQIGWSIAEDESNMDYILSVPEQVQLKGNRFASKRYNINKFNRSYADATHKDLDLRDTTTKNEVLELFDSWADRKATTGRSHTINERKALERIFDLLEIAKLSANGIYVNGQLKCFVICEEITDGYVVAHFQKGLPEYYGIFTACLHQACIKFYQKGYLWINIEQALGESGLTLSKELYRPSKYLKKFSMQEHSTPA